MYTELLYKFTHTHSLRQCDSGWWVSQLRDPLLISLGLQNPQFPCAAARRPNRSLGDGEAVHWQRKSINRVFAGLKFTLSQF